MESCRNPAMTVFVAIKLLLICTPCFQFFKQLRIRVIAYIEKPYAGEFCQQKIVIDCIKNL